MSVRSRTTAAARTCCLSTAPDVAEQAATEELQSLAAPRSPLRDASKRASPWSPKIVRQASDRHSLADDAVAIGISVPVVFGINARAIRPVAVRLCFFAGVESWIGRSCGRWRRVRGRGRGRWLSRWRNRCSDWSDADGRCRRRGYGQSGRLNGCRNRCHLNCRRGCARDIHNHFTLLDQRCLDRGQRPC